MKKKTISKILILTMLLLPFSVLLNVKATTTNGVTYNESVTKTGDNSSYKVTATGDIIVGNVNYNSSGTTHDTFSAYKIVDVFYNPTTNQFSYQFTTTFATFVGTLTQAEIRSITGDQNATTFTVDDYMNSTKITNDQDGANIANTTSSLNVLVSKYATYIKTNNVSGTAITLYGDYDNDNEEDEAKLANAEVGSYLILPDSTAILDAFYNLYFQINHVYGVMVANLMYETSNGAWQLNTCTVYSKRSENALGVGLFPITYSIIAAANNGQIQLSEAETARYDTASGLATRATSGGALSGAFTHVSESIPANIHSSINSNIINLTKHTQVSLPTGFTFDYNDMGTSGTTFVTFTKIGNNYYAYGTETASDDALRVEPISSTVMNVYNSSAVFASINVSNSQAFTAGTAYTVTAKKYYIKDAYVDIGENVTTAEVEAALDPTLQNPTSRQQAIQRAIGVMTQEATITLYGVRVNNTNSSNVNLSGGVFQAYSDAACTQTIGQPFTMTSGTGSFVGISGLDVVYIKQLTAPSGYRLFTDIIDVHPFSDNDTAASGHVKETVTLGQDNYYEITVVNQANLSLPFTGGSGTVIYTVIGLVIVVGAGIFLVLYKKKNKKDNNNKE